MKKLLLNLIVILALVVAGLYGYGTQLPKDHEVSVSMAYNQPQEALWDAITNYAKLPEWSKSTAKAEALEPKDGKPVWRLITKHGEVMDLVIDEETPMTRHVATIANDNLPFGGSWIFELTPTETGTRVTLTEKGYLKQPILRALSALVWGHDHMLKEFLTELGAKFGETVQFD